jgi:hypothetical protein
VYYLVGCIEYMMYMMCDWNVFGSIKAMRVASNGVALLPI